MVATLGAIHRAGFPVMGHVGLTPQNAAQLGGLKVQGRTAEAAQKILEDALRLEDAGAFVLILECVPDDVSRIIREEMTRCLDERPDQPAFELLVEFQARYPGRYSLRQLHALQKRVRLWRQQPVQRLIHEVTSNILGEAAGNKITWGNTTRKSTRRRRPSAATRALGQPSGPLRPPGWSRQ